MKTVSEGRGPTRNIGASVRARLLNIARSDKRDYNALLLQFVQERFLYRLSVSPFSKQFIIKGALLLRAYPLPVARPTRDIDFLGHGTANDLRVISEAVRSIQKVKCDDGVEFQPEKTSIEQMEFPVLLDFPSPHLQVYSLESAIAEKFE